MRNAACRAGVIVRVALMVAVVSVSCAVIAATVSGQQQSDPHWGRLQGEAPHSHVDTSLLMYVVGLLLSGIGAEALAIKVLFDRLMEAKDAQTKTVEAVTPLTTRLTDVTGQLVTGRQRSDELVQALLAKLAGAERGGVGK